MSSANKLCKLFGPRSDIVGPDVDPNFFLHTNYIHERFFSKKMDFEKKKSADDEKVCKISQHAIS